MANDKLFQKRKAATRKSLQRRAAARSERKRALIVCEDEISVPSYLRKLIRHLGLNTVDIQIYGKECGSAPRSVIDYGQECLEVDADFDFVYFVFDKDAHTTYTDALGKVTGLRKNKKYKASRVR